VIEFTVLGTPAPKGSVTRMPNGAMLQGRDANERERIAAWATAVADAANRVKPDSPIDEPVSVTFEFFFPLPASDRYRTWHAVTPDGDKCARNTADALKVAGVIRDDSLISRMVIEKRYARDGDPLGARIRVEPLGEAQLREALKAAARSAKNRREVSPVVSATTAGLDLFADA
jgi:Holliday junction resolvase RusA-like endonuclease